MSRVLLISPYGEEIAGCFTEADEVTWRLDPAIEEGFDWVVCYGCRKMIRGPWLTTYKNRMINIHISYLPYNRGADPNFWSWFDDTPKGVTVHEIDEGLDTGRIVDQSELKFKAPEKHTLRTSYEALRRHVPTFFEYVWKNISKGEYRPVSQNDGHSDAKTHKVADKEQWMALLPMRWHTPVLDVQKLGEWQKQE